MFVTSCRVCSHCENPPLASQSMFKMPDPGCNHGQAVFVTVSNRLCILDGASRLNYSCYSGFMRYFNAIGKRKESVRCHYGPVKVKFKRSCFLYRLIQRIHSRCLSGPASIQLLVFRQHYSVRLRMFHQDICEQQIFRLFFRWNFCGYQR